MSLVDYEFRPKLQDCLLEHAEQLWQRGVSVVIEFGSWHREEREAIRRAAVRRGATTELHYLDAPIDELVRRVRARAEADAEALATNVLQENAWRFESPTEEEIARFDRYLGPGDDWAPG
jgi:predicted kinase